jgi:hypothetical protein
MVKTVDLSTALEGLQKLLQEKGFHGDVCVRKEDVLPIFSCKSLRALVETKTVNDVTRLVNKIRKKQKKREKLRSQDWEYLKHQKMLIALIRLRRALDPIREILSIYRFGQNSDKAFKSLQRSWSRFILACTDSAIKDELEVTLKHDFQIMLAKGCGKPVDSGYSLFKGRLSRIINVKAAAMNKGETKCASFLRSIYESKKNWEQLSTAYKTKAKINHQTLMTTPGSSSEEAIKWIHKAVDMIIPFGTKYRPGTCVPTYGASYQSSRKCGGNHGFCSIGEEIPLMQLPAQEVFSNEQMLTCTRDAYLSEDKLTAQFQAIPEPGKFRVITKGDSDSYTALRPLQKFLLNRWKQFTMNSMSADFEKRLHERMTNSVPLRGTKHEENAHLYDHFVSGDYSNATDAMHRDATKACIERILFNLEYPNLKHGNRSFSPLEQQMLLEELCETITNPEILYDLGSQPVKTCRGQLMGHPISFPLLCIINLSTFLRTFEYENRREIRSHPSFINGDDILFKGDITSYDRWRKFSGDVGLKVNEVKTYFHKQYYLINSILGKNGKTIEYLNVAVAHGVSIQGEPIRSLLGASQIWELLSSYRHGASRLCARYVKSLAEKLPKMKIRGTPFSPNFFIIKELGGLGLKPNRPVKLHTNQRKLATYLWENPMSVISEKIGEMPSACILALEKFRRMRPSVERILCEGPAPENADPVPFEDHYLMMAQKSTAYIHNTNVYDPLLYELRFNLRQLRDYQKSEKNFLKPAFIKSPPPFRRMVWGAFDRV